MKKFLSVVLVAAMFLSLANLAIAEEKVSVTMWTYPIGGWGKAEQVDQIVAAFYAVEPNIEVKVEYLDYTSGDDQVTSAIEAGTTPDIIMEGPERLVANWGAKGKILDVNDLWTEKVKADIDANSPAVAKASMGTDGNYYEYPLAMTTHTMAINYEVFEKANALQYLDLENRTWTTENFQKAMQALKDDGVAVTGIVYCGGQGGDQGTRALAMNLFSANFTNPEHTEYTMNSEAGIKGLQLLADMVKDGLLEADAGIAAGDELQLFANGTAQMTWAWNASNAANYAASVTFTPYAMAFPSDDGVPELAGGIWGFGLFDNKDEAKVAAAKKFIKFVSDDSVQGPASVFATGFFPVRASFGDIYAGTEKDANKEFLTFMPYLGDYYNVTPNWAVQRTEWWNLLQRIFAGEAVETAVATYISNVNIK
ncbi:MAG: extracellular solute-binding protein [Clostridiales bacterium]|nr:extracellular solute-binding protein [Clostridiales bacterium]